MKRSEVKRVTVNRGPYATVRAILKSKVKTPARCHIVAVTERGYVYEVWPSRPKIGTV